MSKVVELVGGSRDGISMRIPDGLKVLKIALENEHSNTVPFGGIVPPDVVFHHENYIIQGDKAYHESITKSKKCDD